MTKYEAWLPYVVPFALGVPEVQAVAAVRDAAIEFCDSTSLLQADIDPISTVAKVALYDLESPLASTTPVRILTLYHQEARLSPVAPSQLDNEKWQDDTGAPRYYLQQKPKELLLVPTPDKSVANVITGRIVVVPTRASTECDDVLFERHAEGIAAGALARVLLTPGQPYSNPQSAAHYALVFASAKSKARALVNAGGVNATLRVRMRRF